MGSWIACHNVRQTVSTFCYLVFVAILLVDCNAQTLKRGVQAPKNKFIRFGRSSSAYSEPELSILNIEPPVKAHYFYRPFSAGHHINVVSFKTLVEKKRGGQKFIRFGRK